MVKFLRDNSHIIFMCTVGLIIVGSLGFMAYNYIGTEHWVEYGGGRSVVDLRVYELYFIILTSIYLSSMLTRK